MADQPSGFRARVAAAGVAIRRRGIVAFLLGLLAVLVVFLLAALVYVTPRTPGREVGLGELQTLASAQQVTDAVLHDEDARVSVRTGAGDELWTAYPSDGALTSSLVAALRAGGADVTVDQQAGVARVRFLAQTVLPVLLLADLFALLLAAGASGRGRDLVRFGRLEGGRVQSAPVRFGDVGGADEAVAELAEVRDYLSDPQKYRTLGAAPPKGVLLFGPPGTGKTLLARAVAGEAGVPFYSVAGAEFVESLVGVGAARVRDLFARVRAVAPAIVFIDELDAVGRRRGAGAATGGTDERENTLNQLLVEMDGFDAGAGIVVIAATNRPDILDPALTRPGRFDRHVTLERPTVDGRLAVLRVHSRGKPLADGVDLDALAHRTPGFAGADLANVMNEAALLTARAGGSVVTQERLLEAVDRVRFGPQRRGRLLTDDELRQVAVHECGHAVVAAALGRVDDVHRISVLPKGAALGVTALADDEEVRMSAALRSRLAVLLAGRAAELVVSGDVSTASEHDLERATDLARDMVVRWGMADDVGPVSLGSASGAFLGDATALNDVAPATHDRVDAAVTGLLVEAAQVADKVLRERRSALLALADRLVAEETLEGAALRTALQTVTARPSRRRTTQSRAD